VVVLRVDSAKRGIFSNSFANTPSMALFKQDDETLLKAFYAAKDYKDLAAVLEVTPQQLKYHVFVTPADKQYIQFTINKKDGKKRNICAPNGNLKFFQTKLSYILYKIYHPTYAAKGFVLNESVVTNAKQHVGKKVLLNIDINKFFDSINFGRVYGLFRARPFHFSNDVAAVLANICCFENKLPQGAPTSPILSNIICVGLDKDFQLLAKKYNFSYTRYADDITFSSNFKFLPQEIAQGRLGVVELGEVLPNTLEKHGFKINPNKTRIQYHYNRQIVTGLIVNKTVNVSRRYIRSLRGIIHSIEKFGFTNAEATFQATYSKQRHPSKLPPNLLYFLKGKLSFLAQVKGTESTAYISLVKKLRELIPGQFDKTLTKLEELYSEFKDLKSLKYKGVGIDEKERGFKFEALLADLLKYSKINVTGSFRKVGDEQIDAALMFNSWHYLLECKWKAKRSDTRDVDPLSMKVMRSGMQTGGIFISINGWSKNVPKNIVSGDKNIVLINGDDLEDVLTEKVSFARLLEYKISRLNINSEPYSRWT